MRRALVLCALLASGPAQAQDGDAGILTRFLQNNLSDAGRTVTITGFQGALSSRATMTRLTVADDEGIWLTLNGVTLDWNRAAVLRGEFSVNALTANEVIVARRPISEGTGPSAEARGFSLPELPVSIRIGELSATRLELGADILGTPVEAALDASLRLVGGEGEAALSLLRTDGGPEGRVTVDASYSNATRLLVLDLDAREAAGGIAATRLGLPGTPASELTIAGQGIIDDFAADIRLATDGEVRLAGKVTLRAEDDGATAFTGDLGGNPAPLFLPEQAAFFGDEVSLVVAGVRSASGGLALDRFSVQTRALSLDGSGRIAPDGLPERLALSGRIADAAGEPVLLPGTAARILSAEFALSFDAAMDDGWSGSATLLGLSQPGLAVERMLLTGSGRIGRGPAGNVVGATLRLVAAGIAPTDPAVAQAVGTGVAAQLKASWLEGQPLRLSDVTVAGADYTATTRGTLSGLSSGFRMDGQIEATAADLSRFSGLAARPLGGSATLNATGRGSPLGGDFELDGTVAGEGLRVGQPELDALLRGSSRIELSVVRSEAGTDLRRADLSAATLRAGVTGRLESTGSDLQATLDVSDLRALGGGYRGALAGTVSFAGTAESGRFILDATATDLAVGQPQADLLLRGKSAVSMDLRTENGALRIDRFRLAGPQLSAEATGQAQGGRREIALSARLVNLGLFLPEFPGPVTVKGSALDDGAGYRLDLRGTGPGKIDTQVAGRLAANLSSADLRIKGTAQAALANPFITPRTVSGPLSFDLRLNGPLRADSISGRVSLAEGRLAAPLLRIALQGISAQADIARGVATLKADAAVSAGGRIGLRGTVGLTPPFHADLTISPRDAVLRDPALYETRATGEVRVSGPLTGGARISGTIALPETEIRVPSTDVTGAGAIPDMVHRNEPADVRATRARAGLLDRGADRDRQGSSRPYLLDLTINAPNRVFVRGRGLDAELGGTLRLTGTSANVVPSGAIDLIRGRLDILDRRLDLTEASLRLEGNLDPYLRVVASNESDGITSSVVIDGLVSEPAISFSSSPPLPDEEVLAHLLFGRQLNQLSPFQAAQLANAVATLAGRGGDGLIGKLRRNFGLDDLDIVQGADGGAAVRLGRYVSKNVYTDVTIGSEGTTELNLNLDVRPGVTVRAGADSGGDTSIGIFVDRDY